MKDKIDSWNRETVLHRLHEGQNSLLEPLICPLRSSTININKAFFINRKGAYLVCSFSALAYLSITSLSPLSAFQFPASVPHRRQGFCRLPHAQQKLTNYQLVPVPPSIKSVPLHGLLLWQSYPFETR